MMIRRLVLLLTIGLIGAEAIVGLEIDQDELRDSLDADIEFQNYEGPVDQIDSREAIRGIGRALGRNVTTNLSADYAGRYRIRRIIGDETSRLRAADLLELTESAQVDHIDNLRRIIAGYLDDAWGYQSEDADLLARFITIYNAVHRGDLPFFSGRYRTAVVDALDPERVGLAISYSRWPGQTQLVVPIRPERQAGDLDAVDPGQLVDRAVIAELRTRADLGIEDRKAIIEFIERVIEERTEVIAEERAAIAEEQQEIDERQAEIEEEIGEPQEEPQQENPAVQDTEPAPDQPQRAVATDTTPTDEAETVAPGDDDTPEEVSQEPEPEAEPAGPEPELQAQPDEEPQPDEPRVEELTEEREQLDQREEELTQRDEELDEEEADLQELTEEVEELYQETAEDQAAIDRGATAQELVPFIIARSGGTFELAIVNLDTVEIAGEQTVPVASREIIPYQGGVLAAHAVSGRLLLLDTSSLSVIAESDTTVLPGARVIVVGQSVLTVIVEDNSRYIGQFDAQLLLQRRSRQEVNGDTDIVARGDQLLVQDTNGALRTLNLEDNFEAR